MAALGIDRKNAANFNMLSDLEKHAGGDVIDFEAFIEAIVFKLGDEQTRDGIGRVFDLYDDDKNGSVDFNKLKKVARELGETMTDEELTDLLEKHSSDGKEISRDDFYYLMTEKVYS
jgi:Ca2+-binding EF-hand superfamily protein